MCFVVYTRTYHTGKIHTFICFSAPVMFPPSCFTITFLISTGVLFVWQTCVTAGTWAWLTSCQQIRSGHQPVLKWCLLLWRPLLPFLWRSAKLPSSRQRENKTDLFPSARFLTSLKFPRHQHYRKKKYVGVLVGKPHPPLVVLLTSHSFLRDWSGFFQPLVLVSFKHTDIIHSI